MDGAAFASPRPNPVQRRPAKIVIPSDSQIEEQPRLHSRPQSDDSTDKVHLTYIPPGYRTPSYTSGSSSGGSSPNSVSPSKDGQTHFKFGHRSLRAQHAPNAVYFNNGASVQHLSLKTHRHDPPKQLLSLASQQQQNYSPSESGYSHSSESSSCYSIYGSCQYNDRHDGKQLLQLRSYVSSEMAEQEVCTFCYQFAVHYAHSHYQTPLPRVADRGYWRGHILKEGDKIICPRALRRVCSLCGATGQNAHLNNFCPIAKKHTSSY
ncbi:hypothetical protein PMAYCL1PPCAC_01819 [Pristionchus mayeri]|uniref:Nanos-type domain-containing protein n=1 Tax=Pristionchus mayeri TaxID=1317129 RepID=A0AAN5C7C1_9BILA|nr:hypothetical protein PMAYCL1PPCAC_01819 [Pristionchus mayeri]